MAMDFFWQDGDRVMFIGDTTIDDAEGVTRLVPAMVTARFPERNIDYRARGVGGNRIGDVVERLHGNILGNDPPPNWVVINLGLNDVWDGATGTPLGRFGELYRALIERLKLETGAQLICLTIPTYSEELDNAKLETVAAYNDMIRTVAFEFGAMVVDAYAIFMEAMQRGQAANPRFRYTIDGRRLNTYGKYLLAMALLQALHFNLGAGEPGNWNMRRAA